MTHCFLLLLFILFSVFIYIYIFFVWSQGEPITDYYVGLDFCKASGTLPDHNLATRWWFRPARSSELHHPLWSCGAFHGKAVPPPKNRPITYENWIFQVENTPWGFFTDKSPGDPYDFLVTHKKPPFIALVAKTLNNYDTLFFFIIVYIVFSVYIYIYIFFCLKPGRAHHWLLCWAWLLQGFGYITRPQSHN